MDEYLTTLIEDGIETRKYKCPKPLCSKTYKNPNGLKYHMEKGLCETDVVGRAASDSPDIKVTSKPFVCKGRSCNRRYKNMNGLKYHVKINHPEMDFGDVKKEYFEE